jgi:hypothetical protein
MERVGDDLSGFSIGYDSIRETIHVKAWGFWSVDVAEAFGERVVEACLQRPRGSLLALDMSDLKPMREEGQRSFGNLIRSLAGLGIARTSIVTASHMTKLQLVRLATEYGGGTGIEWIAGVNELGRNA